MIDITTGFSPIERERPTGIFGETVISIEKWGWRYCHKRR